jgi:hypothetical protein
VLGGRGGGRRRINGPCAHEDLVLRDIYKFRIYAR